MTAQEPYNPLAKENLGRSVAEALLQSAPMPLGELSKFDGAGIYALYYVGDLELYAPLAAQNKFNQFLAPIYVGKAVPPGTRKGGLGLSAPPKHALHKRLNDHAKSIEQATNLAISDFFVRILVVDDIWIPLGESLLIASFSPIWNNLVDGFGIHDPGSGRDKQKRSRWDAIHPGRAFAEKVAPPKELAEDVMNAVAAQLRDQFN